VKRIEDAGMSIYLDAMLCVIDCVNFTGYEDTSHTARLQAKYTDMILLNKWEHVRLLGRGLDARFLNANSTASWIVCLTFWIRMCRA
jgi:G3E family GTPase